MRGSLFDKLLSIVVEPRGSAFSKSQRSPSVMTKYERSLNLMHMPWRTIRLELFLKNVYLASGIFYLFGKAQQPMETPAQRQERG